MPPKSPRGVFHRLQRLRARSRRLKSELTFLLGVVAQNQDARTARELKAQLRDARASLSDVEDLLELQASHVDMPLGIVPAATTGGLANA